jgi:hypothetical protein
VRSVPSIDIIEYFLSRRLAAVFRKQIIAHPLDQMVLEGPFDDLMEEVESKHLVYIGTRKSICERLVFDSANTFEGCTHEGADRNITNDPVFVPQLS